MSLLKDKNNSIFSGIEMFLLEDKNNSIFSGKDFLPERFRFKFVSPLTEDTVPTKVLQKNSPIIIEDITSSSNELVKIVRKIRSTHNRIIIIFVGKLDAEKMMYASTEDFEYILDDGDITCEIKNILSNYPKPTEDALEGKESIDIYDGTETKESDRIIFCKSNTMKRILRSAIKAAKTDMNVLLIGETGTGKKLFAQLIHNRSGRSKNKLILVPANILQRTSAESDLFGHMKGSYTGADKDRDGLIYSANDGTLFIDEIGIADLEVQKMLLQCLEDKEIRKKGSDKEYPVDFRLISATNLPLRKKIQEGKFREDLYYRIKTLMIEIPPLRERKEDIPMLIDYFIEKIKVVVLFKLINFYCMSQ